jgi:hypothetical protein
MLDHPVRFVPVTVAAAFSIALAVAFSLRPAKAQVATEVGVLG